MKGAAKMTIGNITIQEPNQAGIQFDKKRPSLTSAILATPEAMADVKPDWMMPKT